MASRNIKVALACRDCCRAVSKHSTVRPRCHHDARASWTPMCACVDERNDEGDSLVSVWRGWLHRQPEECGWERGRAGY
eukprot:scaffold326022_cov58-Tisochrysis_lutea.AAC.1